MHMSSLKKLRRVMTASLMAAACASATAAPFWTQYQGTIADSAIAGVTNGETYTVSFVFDNGSNSANNQSWAQSTLKCVVWSMNNDRGVVFAQDLSLPAHNTLALGQISTNATGGMTNMFQRVGTMNGGAGPGTFQSLGMTPPPVEPYWGMPLTPLDSSVFIAGSTAGVYTDYFKDATGGVNGIPTAVGEWSPIAPFTGFNITGLPGCANPVPVPVPVPVPTNVTAVPTLETPVLALLGLIAAGLGSRRLRKRRNV